MRGIGITLLLSLLACQAPRASEPPTEVKIENLLAKELSEHIASDREVFISYVELPPNTTLPRHWHPGEEFYYVIDGVVTAELDGKRTSVDRAGAAGHIPLKMVHTAITGSEGARLVVFRVHEMGQPHRNVVEQK